MIFFASSTSCHCSPAFQSVAGGGSLGSNRDCPGDVDHALPANANAACCDMHAGSAGVHFPWVEFWDIRISPIRNSYRYQARRAYLPTGSLLIQASTVFMVNLVEKSCEHIQVNRFITHREAEMPEQICGPYASGYCSRTIPSAILVFRAPRIASERTAGGATTSPSSSMSQ